jgi:hypothetical protein
MSGREASQPSSLKIKTAFLGLCSRKLCQSRSHRSVLTNLRSHFPPPDIGNGFDHFVVQLLCALYTGSLLPLYWVSSACTVLYTGAFTISKSEVYKSFRNQTIVNHTSRKLLLPKQTTVRSLATNYSLLTTHYSELAP